jgi:hypothetical protein
MASSNHRRRALPSRPRRAAASPGYLKCRATLDVIGRNTRREQSILLEVENLRAVIRRNARISEYCASSLVAMEVGINFLLIFVCTLCAQTYIEFSSHLQIFLATSSNVASLAR